MSKGGFRTLKFTSEQVSYLTANMVLQHSMTHDPQTRQMVRSILDIIFDADEKAIDRELMKFEEAFRREQ